MQGRPPVCSGSPSCYSSKCGIPQRTRRRYKTIENFLRRIAFNLGNTVSQTDVKILSCIPIDVTDLQQKIIQLEKELQEAKGSGSDNKKKDEKENKEEKKEGSEGEEKKVGEGETPAEGEKKEGEETTVGMMQIKQPTVDTRKRLNSMAPGQNYMRNYLNIDTSGNDIHSLYKAAKSLEHADDTSKYHEVHSSSNTEIPLTVNHSSMLKNNNLKKQKHNPFNIIMGNIKKRKHLETAYRCQPKEEHASSWNRYDLKQSGNSSSYSVVLPRSHSYNQITEEHQHRNKDLCPDCKAEVQMDQSPKLKNRRKIKKKKKENVLQSCIPHNQYIYYAQTNSHFNPTSFKKDRSVYECDLSYIANLINKQYTPMSLFNENKVLHRQFSVPVCRDTRTNKEMSGKYAIKGLEACSCCPGSTSGLEMVRDHGLTDGTTAQHIYNVSNAPFVQQKYNNYIYTNANSRYNDSTLYDIVPVKQTASNKYVEPSNERLQQKSRKKSPNRLMSFVDVDPPFNLHPQTNRSHNSTTNHLLDSDLNHISQDKKYDINCSRRLYTMPTHNKKNRGQKHSSPGKQLHNKEKCSVDPEDIYLSNILQATETSDPLSNDEAAATARSKYRKDQLDEVGPEDVKEKTAKPDETIIEIKAILQNFLKEIKVDVPNQETNTVNEPSMTKEEYVHNTAPNMANIPQSNKMETSQFGNCFSTFPPVLTTGQCCCPILYPVNFIPDAYKAHPPGCCPPVCTTSDCCINKKLPRGDDTPNDDMTETKKLIREIYKSMSIQKEAKSASKTNFIDDEGKGEVHNVEQSHQSKEVHKTLIVTPRHATVESKGCMTCQIIQSESNVRTDEYTTESESKQQTQMQEDTETSHSSVHTGSDLSAANTQDMSDDQKQKGIFSSFLKGFKSLGQKRIKSETVIDKKVSMYENNSSSLKENERSPYRQRITNYTATCDVSHTSTMPARPRYTSHNVNTDNPPEDIYNCCYLDAERNRRRPLNHQSYRTECGSERPTTSKHFHRRSPRQYFDEPYAHYHPRSETQCYCMTERQQIPLCLKEIEVKNAGTQSDKNKKTKLLAVFKKLTKVTDSISDVSDEVVQPQTKNRVLATNHTQTRNKSKPTFLEILKGKPELLSEHIYDYNVLDHNSMANVGMGAKTPGVNIFMPKHGRKAKPLYGKQKGGIWGKQMNKFNKAKNRDMSSYLYKSRNPFSFRNIVMKTLIGQKPVPNTKAAKTFY